MRRNKIILSGVRPFVWLKRFRHRHGYGVHSPFAFGFITDVIYERKSYYCYQPLHERRAALPDSQLRHSERIDRLLFRIANRLQPECVALTGASPLTAAYIEAARHRATQLPTDQAKRIDLLYIDVETAEECEKIFRRALPRISSDGVCILMGIAYSREMRRLWQRLKSDEAVGITFDLFDLGIIFFDRKRFKQHYTVNF
jgi:hypothetical protein